MTTIDDVIRKIRSTDTIARSAYVKANNFVNAGVNIYTTDGSLTSTRTLNLNDKSLTITDDSGNNQIIFNQNSVGSIPYERGGIDIFNTNGSRVNMYINDATGFPALRYYFGTPSSKTLQAFCGIHWTAGDKHFDLVDLRGSLTYATIQSGGTTLFQVMNTGATQLAFAGSAPSFTVGAFTTPSTGAIMEVKSVSKGTILNKMTNTQRDAIATPTEGLIIYSTSDHQYQYYNGSVWGPF